MNGKKLSKEDLWNIVIGSAALATGGGGSAPSYEEFNSYVSPFFEKGLKPTLIHPDQIPDNASIYISAGVGGGLERSKRERYGPPIGRRVVQDVSMDEMDRVFPLPSWAEKPTAEWRNIIEKRFDKLTGTTSYGYMPFETAPMFYYSAMTYAEKGKPIVDAETAGYRAVPELSLGSLNVNNVPCTPSIIATRWGDLLVCEKFLSWQRFEDISRHIAITSGGGNISLMSVKGSDVKKATVHGSVSFAMKVGGEIKKAINAGEDPINNIVETVNGWKIFEGTIAGYTNEGKDAFTWGNGWIKGTNEFDGRLFRFWYKNENQISWLDGETHVTCPDPFTVIDRETGLGLSNFRPEQWPTGRKVAVVGLKSADVWRSERGLKIYNPQHFGFEIKYKPIEDIMD